MNRFIRSILAAATALLLTGCADPYYQRLDELQERVDALQELCDQINKDLSSLQALVKAIDSKDMITGITEIRSGSVVTGYRINFVQHESITITNGKDGASPLVSSRQNPDDKNYYWAIRYGDGDWEWLRAADGTMLDRTSFDYDEQGRLKRKSFVTPGASTAIATSYTYGLVYVPEAES